ncbi:ATP-binding cassette domain-containing protein [Phytoactinopolyspora mesophila]|uniref:ATP-binding cassette domain-containing protein n=1 Tax=Phytoactinopolyspora mesophila TaxID=2650750 RepID=A0A7K3LZV0_9ACTN|nr:ATP-binding cassette domain-containing protein [Phytoactinopolyspora mesophila]
MTHGIDVRNLTARFGDVVALDNLSFSLTGGKIYGLLGRNGSGKTTLLSIIAAFRAADDGIVLVDGREPFENGRITEQICLIREAGNVIDGAKVQDVLKMSSNFRPHWDADYAAQLADMFELPMKKKVSSLSRGQQSAVGITVGMATRAPVTMFDESYLGMDAPSRYAFYDELLRDYMEHPRTIIISTHLIEEVASLFEEVLILDDGRLVAHDETDMLVQRGVSIAGRASVVDEFTKGLTILSHQQLGGTKSTTVFGQIDEQKRAEARAAGLELGPVGLQDLFVHLTKDGRGPQ